MKIRIASHALLALLMIPLGIQLFRAGSRDDATLAWDPSSHALNGLRMTQGITRLEPLSFLRECFYPHHYPPVHSALQVPFYLVLGPTPAASRLPTILAVAAAALVALALAIRLGGDPLASALILAAAFWTSPHFLTMSAVPMLEVFGALGLLVVALTYIRSQDRPESSRWAALSLALLYLTASNWAVIAAAALALDVARRHGWRAPVAAAREFFRGYRPLNLFNIVIVLALLAALEVKITGGHRFGRVSVTSPLGPLSIAVYAALAQAVWIGWRRRDRIRQWPVAARAWLTWCGAPVAVWLFALDPSRPRQTIDFMGGAASPLPLGSRLLYYPAHWFADFHASIAVGVAVLAGLAVLLARWKSIRASDRFVPVLLGTAMAALMAHPARELRFLVGVLPLFWVCVAGVSSHRWVGLAAALAVVGLSAPPALALHRGALAERVRNHYLQPHRAAPAEFIGGQCAEARESFRVFGTFDGLTHHVLEFEVRRRRSMSGLHWGTDLTNRTRRNSGPDDPRAWFEQWIGSRHAEEIVVTIRSSDEFVRGHVEAGLDHFATLQLVEEWLEACPRYRRVTERVFPEGELRVCVWRRTD